MFYAFRLKTRLKLKNISRLTPCTQLGGPKSPECEMQISSPLILRSRKGKYIGIPIYSIYRQHACKNNFQIYAWLLSFFHSFLTPSGRKEWNRGLLKMTWLSNVCCGIESISPCSHFAIKDNVLIAAGARKQVGRSRLSTELKQTLMSFYSGRYHDPQMKYSGIAEESKGKSNIIWRVMIGNLAAY